MVIMFCPNEDAFFRLPDGSSYKMIDYALSKKITLSGPSSLYATLKSVERSWKIDKQSRNIKDIVDIANKISSQAVEIYESAEEAKKYIAKTSEGIEKVTNKIKDGKGSFLSRIIKMNKLGGLFPKKQLPSDLIQDENPNDDSPTGGVSGKIFTSDEKEKPEDSITNKKK